MPWNLHTNYRDAKAWADVGLAMSTTSNEASKMYDASLTQACGYYNDDSVGGLEGSIKQMLEADPEFVMGHVLNNVIKCTGAGSALRLDPQMQKDLDLLLSLSKKGSLNHREMLHVQALDLLANENMAEACLTWDDLLVHYPTDVLAIKFNFINQIFQGKHAETRDCLARVLPFWTPEMPHYSNLLSMYGFGLNETGQVEQAEKQVRKGLELNSRDGWATHSLAHIFETDGRYNAGCELFSSTTDDWGSCGLLACHNNWHWGVYHIEKGDYEGALGLYDTEVGPRFIKSQNMNDLRDASSLLYRLELQGVDVGDRWHDVYETSRSRLDHHVMAFDDAHIIMAVLGDKQRESAQKFMTSLREFVSDIKDKGSNHVMTRDVGIPLCASMVAYDEADFAKAVELLMPVRYKVNDIGGSNAQRDIFNQFLICACLKSSKKEHNKLARQLLVERKALKEDAPLTDRWMDKAMAQHIDE